MDNLWGCCGSRVDRLWKVCGYPVEAAGGGAWVSHRVWSRPSAPPRLLQLTFGRWLAEAARFTADGHTIVYAACWVVWHVDAERVGFTGASPGGLPQAFLFVRSTGQTRATTS